MKKLLALLLAAALAFSLCSCSLLNRGKSKQKETEPPVAAVITDSSVGELHFTVPEYTYVEKKLEQRATSRRTMPAPWDISS